MAADQKSWRTKDWLVVAVVAALVVVSMFFSIRMMWRAGWRGMLDGTLYVLGQLGLVIAAAVAYYLVLAVVLLVGLVLTGTKARRARVFVSFQHDFEDIATAIAEGLARPALEVKKLPFAAGRAHGDVIRESRDAVRWADVVVAVPGPELSWMGIELGVASDRYKAIAVIRHLPDQTAYDALHEDYPLFDWDKLRLVGMDPLAQFILFASNNRADFWTQYARIVGAFWELLGKLIVAWFLVNMVADGVIKVTAWFDIPASLRLTAAYYWVSFSVAALLFAVAFVIGVVGRIRGLRVARQKIAERTATFAELAKVFAYTQRDSAILQVLSREPLKPRHEAESLPSTASTPES